ncbi:hypothetical protein IP88_16150 [alpha proteobacterium AAP81b]|nr:hypothetical protein IP88_16150 [alpha proteobacterium AAP81b]
MTGADLSFLDQMLREIRADVGDIKRDIHRLELRQTVVEGHLTNVVVTLQGIREELDEMRGDLRVIKRRLDLVEAP